VDIKTIRLIVLERGFRLTGHASIEAEKDGIDPSDIHYAILHGEIIEEYPEREHEFVETYLIYSELPSTIPIHVVVDVIRVQNVVVVTVYVPDRRKWIASQKRRRKKGRY
jgi:hypothetical protein